MLLYRQDNAFTSAPGHARTHLNNNNNSNHNNNNDNNRGLFVIVTRSDRNFIYTHNRTKSYHAEQHYINLQSVVPC